MSVKEPLIYSGKVKVMIGLQAGQIVPMDYKAAQAMVASGQARWTNDESAMPRQLKTEIDAREAETSKRRALSDAKSALERDGIVGEIEGVSEEPVGKIFAASDDGKVFLARPMPTVAEIDLAFLPQFLGEAAEVSEDGTTITMVFANASATYQRIESDLNNDETFIGEIQVKDEPEVEIPDDWREANHLVIINLAKTIRGLDRKAKMTKVEAIAIVEEWTKTDDQGSVPEEPVDDEPRGGEDGKHVVDGNHEDPTGEDAAERARKAEEDFANAKDED